MRFLKSILDFYIRSSLHVAVCFVALSMVYNESYGFYVPLGYSVFLFCAAVAGYDLIKYGWIWFQNHWKINLSIKIITVVAAVVALITSLALTMSVYAWVLLLLGTVINLLYILPVWKGKGLRYNPFFKIFSVAIVWAVLIIGIPQFIYFDAYLKPSIFWEFRWGFEPSQLIDLHTLKIFTLVIALCIPFEIRDLKYDDENLKTLPQVLGVKISKIIGVALCVFYLMIIGYGNSRGLLLYSHEIIMIVITATAIWFSDKFKSDYYASFFVEAIPVLWLGLYYLL